MEKEKVKPLLVLLMTINSFIVLFLVYNQNQLNQRMEQTFSENEPRPLEKASFSLTEKVHAKEGYIIDKIDFKEMNANFMRAPGPKRFLKISFTLLVETPQATPLDEIQSYKSKVIDSIYTLINNTPVTDVLKLEGRESFKRKLIVTINKKLKKDKAVKVLFQNFLVR